MPLPPVGLANGDGAQHRRVAVLVKDSDADELAAVLEHHPVPLAADGLPGQLRDREPSLGEQLHYDLVVEVLDVDELAARRSQYEARAADRRLRRRVGLQRPPVELGARLRLPHVDERLGHDVGGLVEPTLDVGASLLARGLRGGFVRGFRGVVHAPSHTLDSPEQSSRRAGQLSFAYSVRRRGLRAMRVARGTVRILESVPASDIQPATFAMRTFSRDDASTANLSRWALTEGTF